MTARLLLQHQTTTAAAAGAANAAAGAAGVFAVHLLADATDVGTGERAGVGERPKCCVLMCNVQQS